jgi:hypothetical protein
MTRPLGSSSGHGACRMACTTAAAAHKCTRSQQRRWSEIIDFQWSQLTQLRREKPPLLRGSSRQRLVADSQHFRE